MWHKIIIMGLYIYVICIEIEECTVGDLLNLKFNRKMDHLGRSMWLDWAKFGGVHKIISSNILGT